MSSAFASAYAARSLLVRASERLQPREAVCSLSLATSAAAACSEALFVAAIEAQIGRSSPRTLPLPAVQTLRACFIGLGAGMSDGLVGLPPTLQRQLRADLEASFARALQAEPDARRSAA